jgi:peptidoglycan/LPS O-acetylase OafA/YrhL
MLPVTNHVVRRLDSLDALRGLAALSVVVVHMLNVPQPAFQAPQWAALLAQNAGSGVALFFVVSAFSLFYTMPLRLRDEHPWTSFFVHRFFRIAPLFFFWIVASLVRNYYVWGKTYSLTEIAASGAFLFNLVPGWQEGFVWASWTIGIEMLFYVLFPLFYFTALDRWRSVALLFGTVLLWTVVQALAAYVDVTPAARNQYLHWTVIRHLPIFACGAIAFHWLLPYISGPATGAPAAAPLPASVGAAHHAPDQKPSELSGLGCALVVGFAMGYTAYINDWLPNLFGTLYVWQGIVYAMLVVGLALWPIKLLVNKATAFLGKVSYSLYLNHPTVVFFLWKSGLYQWLYDHANLTVAFVTCWLITVACLVVVSELTYRFIEVPGMNFGKKVAARLSPRKQPPAPPSAPAAPVLPQAPRVSAATQI